MAKRKLTKPKEKDRKQKFADLVAQGVAPYRAALEAGYAESTAKRHSHEMKKSEKCQSKLEELKPIVEEVKKEEIKYSVLDCFNEFEEIRKLAMLQNSKGDYCNLSAATKAVENKGKLVGAFEADNEQKKPQTEINNIVDEQKIQNALFKLNNISNEQI